MIKILGAHLAIPLGVPIPNYPRVTMRYLHHAQLLS